VEAKQDKAVRFLEDVVGDQDKADEIAGLTVEQYAERKRIQINGRGSGVGNRASAKNGQRCSRRLPVAKRRTNAPEPEFFEIYQTAPGRETELVGVERSRTDAIAKGRELARREEDRGRRAEFRIVPFGSKENPNGDGAEDHREEAEELYRKFHGAEPEEVREYQKEIVRRKNYAALGTLAELTIRTPAGDLIPVEWPETQSQDTQVMVASNALRSRGGRGNQLYLIGGDQNLDELLDQVPGGDKDFVKLGKLVSIAYITRKDFDAFEEIMYTHRLGEEGGQRPDLMYDRLDQQLYIVGGEYDVDRPGIQN
jgi:hypothetical protein